MQGLKVQGELDRNWQLKFLRKRNMAISQLVKGKIDCVLSKDKLKIDNFLFLRPLLQINLINVK